MKRGYPSLDTGALLRLSVPSQRRRFAGAACGRSRLTELLILCARIGFNP